MRKIIQFRFDGQGVLHTLYDDGTLWYLGYGNVWIQIPTAPATEDTSPEAMPARPWHGLDDGNELWIIAEHGVRVAENPADCLQAVNDGHTLVRAVTPDEARKIYTVRDNPKAYIDRSKLTVNGAEFTYLSDEIPF